MQEKEREVLQKKLEVERAASAAAKSALRESKKEIAEKGVKIEGLERQLDEQLDLAEEAEEAGYQLKRGLKNLEAELDIVAKENESVVSGLKQDIEGAKLETMRAQLQSFVLVAAIQDGVPVEQLQYVTDNMGDYSKLLLMSEDANRVGWTKAIKAHESPTRVEDSLPVPARGAPASGESLFDMVGDQLKTPEPAQRVPLLGDEDEVYSEGDE